MRGLSALEVEGLVSMEEYPDRVYYSDCPLIPSWNACVARGLATHSASPGVQEWQINDLGRLALRVHRAVTHGT